MEEAAVRWNIKVSKETDRTLRTFLGTQGMKKGDLSRFIEEAVRWRVFHRTVQDIKARNADLDPEEMQSLVSALLVPIGSPAAIYRAWQEGFFTLLVCAEQLDELRATLASDRRAHQTV